MTSQSSSKWAPWDLTQFSQSPSTAPLYFPKYHWRSEISFLSKVILVLGKAKNCRAPYLGCRGCWVTWVICCFTKKLCVRCDAWVGMLSWWSCQSLVAHSCGLLNHLNSFHGGMFKLNTKFDANSLLYSLVILNAMVTQYTCSFNSVCCPSWLVHWIRHCSLICIPVQSPQLPGYIDVTQTVHVVLTMAGLFLDRPRVYTHTHTHTHIAS